MTDTGVAAVMTAWLDRAGKVGHCWFIQTAREISRKRNGSRHFDIGSSNYRRRQGLSPAVSDRSSFRAIRQRIGYPARRHHPKRVRPRLRLRPSLHPNFHRIPRRRTLLPQAFHHHPHSRSVHHHGPSLFQVAPPHGRRKRRPALPHKRVHRNRPWISTQKTTIE